MPPVSRLRKLLFRLAAPAAALLVIAALDLAGVLPRLDRAWFDLLQRRTAAAAPLPPDTAIVLIDENALRVLGADPYAMRWPWPRNAFAALFACLHHAGARRIAGDFIFFEQSEQDAFFGAIAAGLPGLTLGARREPDGSIQTPIIWPEDFRRAQPACFDRPRWGLVDVDPDSDGVVRSYPGSGSLMDAAFGRPPDSAASQARRRLLRWRGGLDQLRRCGVPVLSAAPFVQAGLELLNRALADAPEPDPAALVAAIDRQPPPDGDAVALIRGRTVFVGVNAAGTFDAIATPVGAPEPGVLLHWTAWADQAAGDFLRAAGRGASAATALLALALVAFAGRSGRTLRRPALAAGGSIVGALGASAAAFAWADVWFAPALPATAGAIMFTAVAVESFRLERERKREIQSWFGAYVSPAVVRRLVRNPDALALGGERREVTVFFSDLVGFTSLSENRPEEEVIQIVNACLDALSPCIHDRGGYLDKYIGDAIMGVFGIPEDLPEHPLAACHAALDARARLAELNERLERDYGVRLGMRIGINTGPVVVGNVGSARKKNYTVLGDTVNLASRLEAANKEFGSAILLGPITATQVAGRLVTRPLARLQVKGRTQPADVHELIGEPGTCDDRTREFAAVFAAGFAAYCERRFADARAAFERAETLRSGDRVTTRYLLESRALAATPPDGTWSPILKLESK